MPDSFFQKLTVEDMYGLFTNPHNNFPNWPSEQIQKGYTGTNQLATLRQALHYLKLMEEDGAFVENWRGLDYACGWGRFASALLKYGAPEQLDLVDAWPKAINFVKSLGFANKISLVSELIQKSEIKDKEYDFVLSFSLFTHLNKAPFEHNLKMLASCIKDDGKVYFTVRHDNFFDHKYKDKADKYRKELGQNSGFWFRDTGGDQTKSGNFGDSVITQSYLAGIDPDNLKFRYLGAPNELQKMYVMEKK